MWLLTVYEMPKTVKEWRGESISISGSGSDQIQLPFSSVAVDFKVAKCRVTMMLRDSRDELVRGAVGTTRTGCKWDADVAEEDIIINHGLNSGG